MGQIFLSLIITCEKICRELAAGRVSEAALIFGNSSQLCAYRAGIPSTVQRGERGPQAKCVWDSCGNRSRRKGNLGSSSCCLFPSSGPQFSHGIGFYTEVLRPPPPLGRSFSGGLGFPFCFRDMFAYSGSYRQRIGLEGTKKMALNFSGKFYCACIRSTCLDIC